MKKRYSCIHNNTQHTHKKTLPHIQTKDAPGEQKKNFTVYETTHLHTKIEHTYIRKKNVPGDEKQHTCR